MKIFTGEVPKNPCEGCAFNCLPDERCCLEYTQYLQSILNQCVEVDIDAMLKMYHPKCFHKRLGSADGGKTFIEIPFSQFIQSEIEKQEANQCQE